MSKRNWFLLIPGVLVVLAAVYFARHRPPAQPAAVARLDVFDGCGMEGNAQSQVIMALNRLKNRYVAPRPGEIDPGVTLAALLAPGDDTGRWRDAAGAEVTAYVWDVKPGGVETVNCDAKDLADRDTHIELVLDPAHSGPRERVIVEVTPRWRSLMAAQGVDWSTPALERTLRGRWVRVRGWLLFDAQHSNEAENTAPGHAHDWRATAWEIHPITAIELVTDLQHPQ